MCAWAIVQVYQTMMANKLLQTVNIQISQIFVTSLNGYWHVFLSHFIILVILTPSLSLQLEEV